VLTPTLATAVPRAAGVAALGALVVLAAAASVAVGSVTVPLGDVVAALTAYDGSEGHTIVRDLRLPRTLVGVAVGAALGIAGAVVQAMTRNPLADPGLLGIEAGAALAVVLAILLLGVGDAAGHAPFAFVGATAAGAVVHLVAAGTGPRRHGAGAGAGAGAGGPVALALAGAALAALLTALTSAIIVTDAETLDEFRFWIVGSLAGRDLTVLGAALPLLAAGVLLAAAATRALDALALAADVAGRLLVRPAELQVGIVLALVGAPVFILIVRRRRLAQL